MIGDEARKSLCSEYENREFPRALKFCGEPIGYHEIPQKDNGLKYTNFVITLKFKPSKFGNWIDKPYLIMSDLFDKDKLRISGPEDLDRIAQEEPNKADAIRFLKRWTNIMDPRLYELTRNHYNCNFYIYFDVCGYNDYILSKLPKGTSRNYPIFFEREQAMTQLKNTEDFLIKHKKMKESERSNYDI